MFSPFFSALAGIGPGLSLVGTPVQPEIRAAAASKSEGEGVGSPERRGAPLEAGLPNTRIEACQELMLAIIMQGLRDDDLNYVLSPTFIHHCCYVGLDPDTALNIKVKYLRREIDPANLWIDSRRGRRGLEA